MPVCHHCERVQPTAELRRTTLGHLCKENGKGTPCHSRYDELRAERRALARETRRAERSAA